MGRFVCLSVGWSVGQWKKSKASNINNLEFSTSKLFCVFSSLVFGNKIDTGRMRSYGPVYSRIKSKIAMTGICAHNSTFIPESIITLD